MIEKNQNWLGMDIGFCMGWPRLVRDSDNTSFDMVLFEKILDGIPENLIPPEEILTSIFRFNGKGYVILNHETNEVWMNHGIDPTFIIKGTFQPYGPKSFKLTLPDCEILGPYPEYVILYA